MTDLEKVQAQLDRIERKLDQLLATENTKRENMGLASPGFGDYEPNHGNTVLPNQPMSDGNANDKPAGGFPQ
jgi:hypothetical protein